MTPTLADHEALRRELAEMRVLYWTANGPRAQMELALAAAYTTQHCHDLLPMVRGCPGCDAEAVLMRLADKLDRAGAGVAAASELVPEQPSAVSV